MIHCRLVRLGEETGGSSEQLQQRGRAWKLCCQLCLSRVRQGSRGET